jgi:hypothetical protein
MSEQNKKEETVTLTTSALKEILADQASQNADNLRTIVEELKKPTVLEQKELNRLDRETKDRQEERKANSDAQKQKIENKRLNQQICSHKHRDGNSHCVLVQVQHQPDYILCQKNQCKIRPGKAPDGYKGTDIYDTRLYNDIFQTLPGNEMFG